MSHVEKLHDISLRLDQLENTGDWLARALVHKDGAASQAGSLITVLAQDIRDRVLELITTLEKELVVAHRENRH